MTSEPKTILDVIDASMKLPEIGHGIEATVYPLAGSEGEFVLRVRDDTDFAALLSTTSLSPVNYGFGNRHLAPPLMQAKGISIHPRQPGMSLTIYWQTLTKKHLEAGIDPILAEMRAYEEVLQMMANLPLQVYVDFLSDMNFLTARKRSIEPNGDNIMLSENTLRWVDVGRHPTNNHLENVKKMMFGFKLNAKNYSPSKLAIQLRQEIEGKLDEAAKQTHTPLNAAEVVPMIPSDHRFAGKHRITEIGRLPLSETPHALQAALHSVKSHIERDF